jgi:hypothetical protein
MTPSRKRAAGGIRLSPSQRRELDYALECDRRAATMPSPNVASSDEIATLAILELRWAPSQARAFLNVSRDAAEAIVLDPSRLTRAQRESIVWLLTMGPATDNPADIRRRAIAARLRATLPQ